MNVYEMKLTDVGYAKDVNSLLPGNSALKVSEFAVGDGQADPDYSATTLQNEVWRGEVAGIMPHPDKTDRVIVSCHIPSNVGGFWIRELGLFDADGDLVGVVKAAEKERLDPELKQLDEQLYVIEVITVNPDDIEVLIDPSIIYATQADLDALRAYVNTQNQLLREELTPSPIEQEWRNGWL